MRNRTKTTDQLPRMDMGLRKDVLKADGPKKIGTTLLIKEIYQPNIETNPNQDQISSINNRQAEFFKSPSKRSFSLPKVNGLSKDESIEEQGMEREYDFTQGNPLRAKLMARDDDEELRDDIRSENSRGSDGIGRIPEGLGSNSGTVNRRYFSPTWRMEQGTDEMDKKQEGDGSHILSSTAVQDLAKQRAGKILIAEVKKIVKLCQQLKIQTQTQHIPGSFKQDNRRTKQVKYPG
ncbi:MAG: hypothetical protein EZS28_004974 [Streblomastix strix]|uniref:Uncharacterized protein n=1 Tax=Streblomastix strix TaxID=222440 RepID=A0A5J4WYS2_9EUKA|nr:MAG: hypothetical protein EZS28_004974 [Streblomastix strix]